MAKPMVCSETWGALVIQEGKGNGLHTKVDCLVLRHHSNATLAPSQILTESITHTGQTFSQRWCHFTSLTSGSLLVFHEHTPDETLQHRAWLFSGVVIHWLANRWCSLATGGLFSNFIVHHLFPVTPGFDHLTK